MSWTSYNQNVTADDVWNLSVPENADPYQFGHASEAAAEIIDSGVLGDPDKYRFNVSLVGHANPNHEPRDGWANDSISISISQA